MTNMLQETPITKEIIQAHGMTQEEYERVCQILGRTPNLTELGIYSVMWSEHCSYKNSKPVLKLFPTEGKNLLVKAGEENAGCVDIGDGLAIVFKIESHNHPSAVEPFQGAATGVGGIIRDIFTMGARPILSMNSLRFGSLDQSQTKHYLRGVVGGIAHYGNCIGIPTIGGEIYFDDYYEGNPLVNAFCLGLIRHDELTKGKASGVGNSVYYVGATTGRDGLGGASFASKELSEASHEDRPAVQVGDPFMEKLLLEACLELVKTDAIVGMQDMGAAGLTCSTCETAARGSVGVEIDLVKVPRRETGMVPYEIMLSESQERMLVIVKKGKEEIVEHLFEKWDLHAKKIGEVKDGQQMRVLDNGKVVADIPAKSLTDEAPLYQRDSSRPVYLDEAQKLDLQSIPEPKDHNEVLLKLLDSPSIASKRWIYEQYDHMVRTDTIFLPGHDAALARIKDTKKGIAISTDCNALYGYLDPYEGGKIAVAEAARNVAASGARPLAITNCLNFGNPMKPEIFWQFRESVKGMSEACRAFNTPVTGGNVSFYNESPKGAIYPTPTVGMVGVIDDVDKRVPSFFQKAGDLIYLLGETKEELGGTQYLLTVHGKRKGLTPRLDLNRETALVKLMIAMAEKRAVQSCHDISDGGFAVAIAECLFGKRHHPLGAEIKNLDWAKGLRSDSALFGESQSRAIVSIALNQKEDFESLARSFKVPFTQIGRVTEKELLIGDWIRLPSAKLETVYEQAIPRRMSK
ncbi:MAG: phosphoribosylformylglycinamidine synthase II [Candidatus Omnitrophica bacterium CG11_big_fil_rev_8_21_14_0_20_45_26]|uniref:Phosphoribosylformylglycinamidine synthase subunit PurL n=1 Tax=Candidatus Abzuiibacterium crystallinum TaxID=1974748 RepID=A0A2H0LRS3_9BACT|nr:MAG: phosphoribosylformylglycinamidine synthase II [Candidatus Omnitrophica bacterium CG11_big_fil_rev_8_21_14_0_20_45_26]PIW65255.1 MAG: phosphoribosylformylglycinamidine synthase subunit PurL [Candidatus Omnitrophica bacterium CG12_big_fil_rev_8_21_14_0_65_45_16]